MQEAVPRRPPIREPVVQADGHPRCRLPRTRRCGWREARRRSADARDHPLPSPGPRVSRNAGDQECPRRVMNRRRPPAHKGGPRRSRGRRASGTDRPAARKRAGPTARARRQRLPAGARLERPLSRRPMARIPPKPFPGKDRTVGHEAAAHRPPHPSSPAHIRRPAATPRGQRIARG